MKQRVYMLIALNRNGGRTVLYEGSYDIAETMKYNYNKKHPEANIGIMTWDDYVRIVNPAELPPGSVDSDKS